MQLHRTPQDMQDEILSQNDDLGEVPDEKEVAIDRGPPPNFIEAVSRPNALVDDSPMPLIKTGTSM